MSHGAAYAVVMTAATTVAAAVLPSHATGPATWDVGGIAVPVVPALIGILATLLVRIIVVTRSIRRRNLRIYNVAITLLTMLGTATYITDQQLGPGASFLTGVGCGAVGVGIIELSRTQFFAALRVGFQTMVQTMFRAPPGPPSA